jgi:hypothetical protein
MINAKTLKDTSFGVSEQLEGEIQKRKKTTSYHV